MEDFDMNNDDIQMDINKLLIYALPEYQVLIESEDIAREELALYDKKYDERLSDRKKKYIELIDWAEKNGIDIPDEAYNYSVGVGDVIARLDEQLCIEINDIEDKTNRYLEVRYDEELIDDAYEAIATVNEEYERIKENYIRREASKRLRRIKG